MAKKGKEVVHLVNEWFDNNEKDKIETLWAMVMSLKTSGNSFPGITGTSIDVSQIDGHIFGRRFVFAER